ncbi:MAG: NADH-quinone oxidoreductase subunit NuoF [Bacteroidia bacterium]|nr:NADH-quinone oxidoreductase subunit NuoF [Bacteroidia bacterium]MCX7652578.1 NADH-quinone oxidoreductase subunit NuoF [Bacteroidia bacterium]MDW8417168.1 NADH-quinone oxidoreductase subunit NuoF [Bacteroidia bacterium]
MDWRSYRPLLLPRIANLHDIRVYESHGGYEQYRRVIESMTPAQVIDEVKAANIRGRGGAGFNAGLKWSFMPPKKEGVRRYLAANGDESEPGTFKDRRILEFNPHLFIEGALIAAYAMQIDAIYVYVRGEYADWIDILQNAVNQAYERGYIGKRILGTDFTTELYVHRGAGAYICGEETGLMESLEGKRAYPRYKPPFPAQKGLWASPTTINNVETLAHVPLVLRIGAANYVKIGAPEHPGPILYGISGHVNRPGVYEYPSGMLIKDLIYEVAGGIRQGKKLKGVVPGGASTPILKAEEIEEVRMSADALRKVGSMMGTGGMLVLDEDTDMVRFAYRIASFYKHESCGQCTPCREGTGWMKKILHRFLNGTATYADIDRLLSVANQMEGRTICALADAAVWPVRAIVQKYRTEFEKVAHPTLVPV